MISSGMAAAMKRLAQIQARDQLLLLMTHQFVPSDITVIPFTAPELG
jgi:hypothetical protein